MMRRPLRRERTARADGLALSFNPQGDSQSQTTQASISSNCASGDTMQLSFKFTPAAQHLTLRSPAGRQLRRRQVHADIRADSGRVQRDVRPPLIAA